MNAEKQKVLIFGLGKFGRGLLKALVEEWDVIAVDILETRIAQCKEEMPQVEYIHGAAESPVTWKKLALEPLKYIITSIHNTDVDLEVCRLARDVHHLKIPIMVMVYKEEDEPAFKPYNVKLIEPLGLGILVVLKKMSTNVSHAANVGLGRGELVEVTVKARSHLVDRKLKYLKPGNWHISALYRNEELILPGGNCQLKIGDRALLVGDPAKLEEVTEILLKGQPQFPLQYGRELVFPLHEHFDDCMDEALYWLDSFKAKRICFVPFKGELSPEFKKKVEIDGKRFREERAIERFHQMFPLSSETGILIVPADQGWFKDSRLKTAFKRATKPFLLSRHMCPYEGVVVLLNGPDPAQAMETGIEIARLLNIEFQALYVTFPKEMRGQAAEEKLRRRRKIIMDYEGIYRSSVPCTVLEGNPVREILGHLESLDNHLVVTVSNPNDSIAFHKPNVPYLVAKRTHLSILVIPEALTDE
ncbi:MAG: hypothetical protein GY940_44730 [bacterium]|nr:hypothetical protein [bacterium]